LTGIGNEDVVRAGATLSAVLDAFTGFVGADPIRAIIGERMPSSASTANSAMKICKKLGS
tara:strand:+ start:885 stop:1064 length:180 start_codon:yes stop_codon:yes gene_type:complete